MSAPTPAVERAAAWMYAPAVKPEDLGDVLAPWQLDAASGALTAALDVEEMARAMGATGGVPWDDKADWSKQMLRGLAAAVRTALIGSAP